MTSDPNYALWQAAFSQFSDAVVLIFDHDLRYLTIGGADLAAQPFNQKAAPGLSLHEAMPPAYVAAFEAPYYAALAGESRTVEFAYGGSVYVVSMTPLHDHRGQVIAGMVVSRLAPAATAARVRDERYQALYHQTNDAVFILDLLGNPLEWNMRAAEMLGYDFQDFADVSMHDVIAPSEWQDADSRLLKLLAGEDVPVYERHFRRKDGSLVTVEINLVLMRDDKGNPASVMSVVRDITERQRAAELLQQREVLHNTVLSSVVTGIMVLQAVRDPAGQVIDFEWLLVNRSAGRFLGRDDLVGKRLLHEMPQIRSDGIFDLFAAVTDTGEPFTHEYRYSLNGEEFWFYVIGVYLEAQDGLVATFRNITANKKAEEALRRSEERFRLVTNVTSDGIYDWDMVSGIDWHSEGYRDAFDTGNAQISEIVAWHERIHPEERERVVSSQLEALQGTAAHWSSEYRMRRRDGEYACVADRAYIMRDHKTGEPTRLIGAVSDITEHRRSQQQALELALQKEKIQILTNLISAVSHDFRTPLSIINTSIYLMTKADDAAERERHAQKLEQQIERVEQLVDGLLTMAWLDRDDALAFDLLDLNSVVEYVETRRRPDCEKKHLALYVDLDTSLPWICGDRDWLNRAILNLLDNAIEHTPDGQSISLHTYRQDDCAVVGIRDTGAGISEAQLPNIFEPLYRAEAHRPLTGGAHLGLSIVHKIIQQHGGRIAVRSLPDVGTTLDIFLPLEDARRD